MYKKIFLAMLLGVLVFGTAGISIASAEATAPHEIPSPDDTIFDSGPNGIIRLLKTVANWLFSILLVLAVIFIILAAYKYLISGGGDGVSKAHKMLIYAIIAIAVAFLARGIVYVVEQLVSY